MARQLSDSNQKKLTDKARQLIADERAMRGSVWLHTGGYLWNASAIIEGVLSVINGILLIAMLIGLLLTVTDGGVKGTDKYASLIYDTRLTVILIGLLLTGFIFHRFKKHVVASALFIAEAAVLIPSQSFRSLALAGALRPLLMFTLPTALMGIAAAYIVITAICDRAVLKRTCDKLVIRIAAAHPSKEGELTSEQQWSDYIDEFISPAVHAKPKRSLRKKSEKEKEKR